MIGGNVLNLPKKINNKLIIISVIFMTIFISATMTLVHFMLDNVIQLTADVHYNQVSRQLGKEIDLLKATTEKIATNENIINLLDNNRTFDQLSDEEKQLMMDQINIFEKILESSRFVDTVNIVSLSGHYLFSKGVLYESFYLTERPWFKEDYLTQYTPSIVTNIHRDFSTGKATIGIVSLIYTKDQTELLGAAVLDIFVEALLEYANSTFYSGELETMILSVDEETPLTTYHSNNKNYYVRTLDGLLNDRQLVFIFDKESIKQNPLIGEVISETKITVLIVGGLIAVALVIGIRLAFKPALKSIEKLKYLMDNLNDGKSILDNRDEFTQLELISNSLGKSFDNKIQSLIYYDSLTGLPNRKKMKMICEELIKNEQSFALVFIDLNKFKTINDVFGHTVGDQLLIKFSQIMQRTLGEKGIITRYSGDEFIVIYKEFKDKQNFQNYYHDQILSQFQAPVELTSDVKTFIEFSTGVAVYPRDGVEVEELINKSDFMMYKNKKDGANNKLYFFNNDIYMDMLYIEMLKTQLKTALQNQEFKLAYQPIVDTNQTIQKVEVLLRWENKMVGYLSPNEFIRYVEENREIIPIGYWIIEEVCQLLSQNNLSIDVSINVSPIQLMEIGFSENVDQILSKYNVAHHQLYFEITESVLLDESDIVIKNIENLRQKGIKFALDDFGTGYSSFSYLKKYPIDVLKIDKIFLTTTSDDDFKIINYINKIAKLLNMQVIVEGVENEEQFNNLCRIKCEFFQGYYFYHPLTSEEFLKVL